MFYVVISIIISLLLCLLTILLVILKPGHVRCDTNECLVGKTALVTGGCSGIGYQIVLSLASRGCKVIVVDIVNDQKIKEALIDETDNENIYLEHVDLGSFESVRKFAEKLNRTEEKLDILINNAGIGGSKNGLTEDGLNEIMQVNYYSHFLLTHLLIDLLKKSPKGKIIFTSSGLSYTHILFPSLKTAEELENISNNYGIFSYPNSKFLSILASDIFAEKLKKSNITCNVYHPYVVDTPIFSASEKNLKNLIDWVLYLPVRFLVPLYGIPANLACQPAVFLTVSKKYENTTGTFFGALFFDSRPRGCSDETFRKNMWEITEDIVKLEPHERL